MEKFLIILPWALAVISSLLLYFKQEAQEKLKGEIEYLNIHLDHVIENHEKAKELQEKLEENYKQRDDAKERLISQLQDKLRRMVVPMPTEDPSPVIMDGSKFKRLAARLEIPARGGHVNDINYELAEFKKNFLNDIERYIYFEAINRFDIIEYYQEIYVSKPESLHYKSNT